MKLSFKQYLMESDDDIQYISFSKSFSAAAKRGEYIPVEGPRKDKKSKKPKKDTDQHVSGLQMLNYLFRANAGDE